MNEYEIHAERKRRLAVSKTQQFRNTNEIWNTLGLNHAWTIGYLTRLFKSKKFNNYADWVKFYYKSGEIRKNLLYRLPREKQYILKDCGLYKYKKESLLDRISEEEKQLNLNFGRTEKDLYYTAKYMLCEIKIEGNPHGITLEDCIDFINIRVLDEIYIGMERERNTVATLKKMFPYLDFKDVSILTDTKYAVDFEVFHENELICAIQVKSMKYKNNNSNILIETKKYNNTKNQLYTKKFGVEVHYVFSEANGLIRDTKIFSTLNTYINGFLKQA